MAMRCPKHLWLPLMREALTVDEALEYVMGRYGRYRRCQRCRAIGWSIIPGAAASAC